MGLTVAASAPGRCGIVGNPSDIYGGNVVSCSIPARAKCRLTFDEETRLPEDTRLWDAAVRRFPIDRSVRVEWNTGIPRSSGLSGSTALIAATIACLMRATGSEPDFSTDSGRTRFAELQRDVEINDAGVKGGYQDAYMIAHGGLRLMRFPGKHPAHEGPFGATEALDAPLPFLLITTGVERLSGSVHGPMIDRWLAGDRAVIDTMLRVAEIALEGKDALLAGDLAGLGALMDENHRLIANQGGSGDAIDRLIALCGRHGALGAKLAGAGLGGTVIALTEDDVALEAALRGEGYSRFLRPAIEPGVRFE